MIETRITYRTTEGEVDYAYFYGEHTEASIRESLARDLSNFYASISKRVRTVAGPR